MATTFQPIHCGLKAEDLELGKDYAIVSMDTIHDFMDSKGKLWEFRKQLVESSVRKAFHIFTNKKLDEMVEKMPIKRWTSYGRAMG